MINTQLYPNLIKDIEGRIFSFLNPQALAYLGQVNTSHDGKVKEYFRRIMQTFFGCHNPCTMPFRCYNDRTLDLKKQIAIYPHKSIPEDIKEIIDLTTAPSIPEVKTLQKFSFKIRIAQYPSEQIPKDITEILDLTTALTTQQIQTLQKFIAARDTLVVWSALAVSAQTQTPFDFSRVFESTDNVVETAKGFASWIQEHKEGLQNITDLSLEENQLTSIPPELGNCQNLETLFLAHNQLTSIPPELGNCQNLEFLVLDHNQLTSIPPELGKCQNLQSLVLDHNQLTSIPPELGNCQNLETLLLDHNRLTSIPPELGNCQQDLFLQLDPLTSIPPNLETAKISNSSF